MAASALQLRAYDPEAMAWTPVPTTGGANSTDKAKMTASNATPAAGSSVGDTNAPATRATGRKGKAFTKLRSSHQALRTCFSSRGIHGNRLRHRLSAYLGPERARATSVLPSRDQNIIIVHTPDIEAADRLIADFAVNTEKGSVPLRGYLRQDGDNRCHGVNVVRNTDTTETLQHRVCWRAGTIVEIRKFGTSNKARITFAGKEKPRYVHYDNMVVSVTIPACGQYGAVGHRADACPNLQLNTCGLCGLHAPLVEGVRGPHNCVPRCSVCGGAHATNSRDCAAKFRTPKMTAKKGGKKKMTPKDQPPPHGGLETRAPETHGKTGACVNAVKNGRQVSNSGGAASSPPLNPLPSARNAEQDQIAALRAQNEMLLKKINELESKINQPISPPSLPTTEVMETELVEPKAETGRIQGPFRGPFRGLRRSIRRLGKRNQNDGYRHLKIARHNPRDDCPTNCALLAPLAQVWRRTPEVDDDDSCSLSGMEDSPSFSPKIRCFPKTNSATPVQIVPWNSRGFRSRAKPANLRLFLSTLDSLPAVVALQEPGSCATLTSYTTFQQDPSSCATPEADNHRLHLWEARHSLVRRWRRQKHNRKLKIRIAELTQRAAEYAAQLADSNWVDRCNTAARQMSSQSTPDSNTLRDTKTSPTSDS
ncbi:hypothetical protein HPB49_011477 [Dermacentor silvarum]|uniref:Uncharacterized protein n=1 Tax=Dermacentor silvarum TaxID=543639 RepID=A0ACB8C910_DERSI|nr:hypothetical protein HPB49_011477 [Dermacentor silvarum]